VNALFIITLALVAITGLLAAVGRPKVARRRLIYTVVVLSVLLVIGSELSKKVNPGHTKMGLVKTLIEKTYNGIEQYHMTFRRYPPDTTPSGLTGIQALHYYLTTTFSPTPNLAAGETWADIYCASCSQYMDREIRTANGVAEIVDPWGAPLIYRLNITKDEHGAEKVEPLIYSCGPNGVDDGGRAGTDDVTVGQ
jgi:hypothetical protein